MQPWDRQPGETDRAWAAFCVYRDMGPGRSVTATASKIRHKSVSQVQKWAAANDWERRVGVFDAHLLQPAVEAVRTRLASEYPEAVSQLYRATLQGLSARISSGDARLSECIRAMEFIGAWIKHADNRGVLDSPEWVQLRTVIGEVVSAHPDVAAELSKRLREIENAPDGE